MYKNGDGVARDEAQAFHWMGKAAVQGIAYAQNISAPCTTTAVAWSRR
jgi:TPR repeat protein